MTAEPERALPAITDLTRPFWDAANEGRLAIQRCQACGYYNHPPKPLCDRCLSDDLAFEDVSGDGTVWSFTVMHQKSIAGFEDSRAVRHGAGRAGRAEASAAGDEPAGCRSVRRESWHARDGQLPAPV